MLLLFQDEHFNCEIWIINLQVLENGNQTKHFCHLNCLPQNKQFFFCFIPFQFEVRIGKGGGEEVAKANTQSNGMGDETTTNKNERKVVCWKIEILA